MNKRLSVLLLTNHMEHFGGSEVFTLELLEAFRVHSCDVDLCVNHCEQPVLGVLNTLKVTPFIIDFEQPINPFSYDIVWSQHQLLPFLLSKNLPVDLKYKTFFCFSHLSPYEPMESLGVVGEDILADVIFANSEETKQKLKSLVGGDREIDVFYNAAPRAFHMTSPKRNKLQAITVVSNHIPNEILEAASILKGQYGIEFTFLGSQSGTYRRVEPTDILSSDAVISIGKTVQYAIAGACPVFCYDHFGGPGWLTLENFKKAEKFNYSGRCCNKKMGAVEIATALISGFPRASNDILKIHEVTKEKYTLDNYINRVCNSCRLNLATKKITPENIAAIHREAEVSRLILSQYRQIIERDFIKDRVIAMYKDACNKNNQKDAIIEQLYNRLHDNKAKT